MKLQTNIPFSPEKNQIDYTSKVMLLGSCFTEHIGGKLDYFKFQNVQNPFGIVFHPYAIESLIRRAVHSVKFTDADVFERDGLWYSFEAHSSVTATSRAAMVALLNSILKQLSTYLLEASHIVFTYGTAWVYRHLSSDTIVANCHKVPQTNFGKELLSIEEISASIQRTIALIIKVNPSVTILTTISPVRHLKDGFIENTRSKAHLVAGLQELLQGDSMAHPPHYFPSYELMMDELREYRFYAEDMVHPNAIAIQYIWEKFQVVWMAPETEALQKEIDTIQKGLQHRPFNPSSDAHKTFQQKLQQRIKSINKQLPHITFQ